MANFYFLLIQLQAQKEILNLFDKALRFVQKLLFTFVSYLQVMHMFKGCRREDTAPHIYSVAQTAYRNLLTTRQDQSIVLLGKSGSGKTTNCQHLVQYLVSIAGSTGKIFSGKYCCIQSSRRVITKMLSEGNMYKEAERLFFFNAAKLTDSCKLDSYMVMSNSTARVNLIVLTLVIYHILYWI